MQRTDLAWVGSFAALLVLLVLPDTQALFVRVTGGFPYLMGFAKFALLATMGELLAIRIVAGRWKLPVAVPLRVAVWGGIGVVITFVFAFFAGGVAAAQAAGALPGEPGGFLFALQTSVIMNLTFGPVLMVGHRLSDTWIDIAFGDSGGASVTAVVDAVDWHGLVGFVLLRTIPLFWIPAHTITFLLPPVYRVVAAALLSIVLGALLAFSKRRNRLT